ncbi:MAG: DUF3800 domain-containing protein [archaeon]
MHLMYVDESGDDGFSRSGYERGQTPTQFYVRVGLILHDWKWKKFDRDFKDYKQSERIPPREEIHATDIRCGRKKVHDPSLMRRRSIRNWFGREYPSTEDRVALLQRICEKISSLDVTIICIAIDKLKIRTNVHNFQSLPKEKSWEFLIERYNLYLSHERDKKGMIISDAVEHSLEKNQRLFASALISQSMYIDEFHFIESILFEPSESSNFLQMADVVAYAFNRKFNSNDDSLASLLSSRMLCRREGGVDGVGLKIWPSE